MWFILGFPHAALAIRNHYILIVAGVLYLVALSDDFGVVAIAVILHFQNVSSHRYGISPALSTQHKSLTKKKTIRPSLLIPRTGRGIGMAASFCPLAGPAGF